MKAHDNYGAALLGAAVRTLFPQALYFGSKVSSRGFFVTFSLDHPFQEGYLRMLDGMVQKKTSSSVEIMEMVGENAMNMLEHHNQPCPYPLSETVFIMKIDTLYEVCQGKPDVCRDFLLLNYSQEGKKVTIWGKAFETRKKKQFFEKQYRKWIGHESIASKLKLYEAKTVHPRGILLKQLLDDFQKKFVESHGFAQVEVDDPGAYAESHLLDRLTCRGYHYVFSDDALISSLQIMQKWINIFGFEGHFALGPKRPKKNFQKILEGFTHQVDPDLAGSILEMSVNDFLGCSERIAYLEPTKKGYRFALTPDLDSWVALLLEKERGNLPNWLVPEQVRLLTEKEVEFQKVTKIFRIANIRYTVDLGEKPLKEKMYRALRVNVPYVMVFGKHEENSDQMTIRALSSNKSKTIDLIKLHKYLAEQNLES